MCESNSKTSFYKMVALVFKKASITLLAIAIVFNAKSQGEMFIKNQGQVVDQDGNFNQAVLFIYSGRKYNVAFYKDHFTYEVFQLSDPEGGKYNAQRIELWYSKPNKDIQISPLELYNTKMNFYKNGCSFLNVSGCHKLVYENVWDGIDIEFIIEDNRLKYDFIVSEKAKNSFSIVVKGAEMSKANGGINLICEDFLIHEKIPFSFIYANGTKDIYKEVITKVRHNKLTYLLPIKRN